jgi:hypothetical protein
MIVVDRAVDRARILPSSIRVASREALAANPMPLPFDGVDWPPLDCSFAP